MRVGGGWVPLSLYFLSARCIGAEYVDLTYGVDERSATWPNAEGYARKVIYKGYTRMGFWYETYSFCISEHSGTHVDAPSHFAEGKWSIEQFPIDHFINRPGVVVDIQEKVKNDSLAELTTNDLMDWFDKNGDLPDGVVVFVRTGWGKRYGDKAAYFGTASNDTTNLIFPGINVGAAQLLSGYEAATGRKVMGIGIDTPSLDNGASTQFLSHIEFALANIYGIENVANLEKLPVKGFHVTSVPMKIREGSGAPVRIYATVPDKGSASRSSYSYALALFLALLSNRLA